MMRKTLPVLLAALLLSSQGVLAQPRPAKSMPEGTTMHRKGAGHLDATGWTQAASTRGGFSVRVPLTFNDFTVISPPGRGPVVKTFAVGAKTAGGAKFLAARLIYRERGRAQAFFSRIAAGKKSPTRTHSYRGRPAVDVKLRNSRGHGHLRYVLVGDSMVMLGIDIPRAQLAQVPATTIQTFLDSLRVSRP